MSHTIQQTRNLNPMWMYEKNYHLLLHVFSRFLRGSELQASFQFRHIHIFLQREQPGKYTEELTLRAELPINQYVKKISMRIRIYHDALLAEVVDYQAVKLHQPVYANDSSAMLNMTDKKQINISLTDLLEMFSSVMSEGEMVTV